MNLKNVLASVIIFSLFITGCNNSNKKEVASDSAKQQITMTKVQNDVNEIMNKDYEYVLNNMGTPYSTTYWIDKEKMNEAKNMEDLNHTGTIGMIYPKDTKDKELNGSALYIELNNNKVIEVQTYDYYSDNIEESLEKDDSVLVIDKYSENGSLTLKEIEGLKIDSFIGKNLDDLYSNLNYINPNLDVYDMIGKTKSVEIYRLNKLDEKDSGKSLTVFANNEKIINLKIIDNSTVIEEARNYLLN